MAGPIGTSQLVTRLPDVPVATTALIDVWCETLKPGEGSTVYVQAATNAGNGVAVEGATIVIALGGDAVATLGASSLVTDVNGRATTSVTVDSGAATDSLFWVDFVSITLP